MMTKAPGRGVASNFIAYSENEKLRSETEAPSLFSDLRLERGVGDDHGVRPVLSQKLGSHDALPGLREESLLAVRIDVRDIGDLVSHVELAEERDGASSRAPGCDPAFLAAKVFEPRSPAGEHLLGRAAEAVDVPGDGRNLRSSVPRRFAAPGGSGLDAEVVSAETVGKIEDVEAGGFEEAAREAGVKNEQYS